MAETLITGYNYMEDGTFSGVYKFPKNGDKEAVHLPPFTTLTPPPFIPAGKKAVWTGAAWLLQTLPLPMWLQEYDFQPPTWFEVPFINRLKAAGVYEIFVHAYFLRGIIAEDSTAYFDTLVQQGVAQRAADRQRAVDADNARLAMEAAQNANPNSPT